MTGGYIVTKEVENVMDLEDYALGYWYHLPKAQRFEEFDQISDQLFTWVKRAHHHDLFHRDLHWRNILFRKTASGEPELFFIDCPRLIKTRLRARHSELVDLSCMARVALSVMSKGRRFKALLKYFEEDRAKTRDYFREIEAHHRRSKHPPKPMQPIAKGEFPK